MQLRTRKLTPEEKVNLAINMSDVVIQICADSIRDQNPHITDAELIEKVRERIMLQKRHRHYEV